MITKKIYEKLKNHNATIFAVLDIQGRKRLCMYKLDSDCSFENLKMFEAVFENRFEVEEYLKMLGVCK